MPARSYDNDRNSQHRKTVHADKSMSDLYGKMREDVEFRNEWAEKCGFGFRLPSVVPNVPKIDKKPKPE